MRTITVLMGEYAIAKNNDFDTMQSPGAETCSILILRSSQATAIAHIDSPHATKQVDKIIDEMRKLSRSQITATIVGGDVYNPISGTHSIYRPIYAKLEKNKIDYKHQHYSCSIPNALFPLCFLALRAWLGTPESYLLTTVVCVFLFLVERTANIRLENTYDAKIDAKTGQITIVTNDRNHSRYMMSDASWEQTKRARQRAALKPQDPRNAEALELHNVMSMRR